MTGLVTDRGSFAGTTAPGMQSAYEEFFLDMLQEHVTDVGITFVMPDSAEIVATRHTSRGKDSEHPALVVHVHDRSVFRKVVCQGNLGLGEAYMAGDFHVEGDRLAEFLTALLRAQLDQKLRQDARFVLRYLGVRLANLVSSKATNVRRHYDVGDDLFDAFLADPYQVYSCGYAHHANDSIESLQRSKLDRICRKLELRPDHHLLDIGSGNGGLLLHAAQNYGVTGLGVTNSRSHCERARDNARNAGLSEQVKFKLADFSEVSGRFDRISSVGMLEHVPARQYRRYFAKISSLLRPRGWALVHAIGMNARRNRSDPFIQKYIFPGSDTPKLSAVSRQVENNNLAIVDVENIARHYAVTVSRWLEEFMRNRDGLDSTRYDASFQRMWEYYLACGIAVALAGNLAVYQVLFTKDYHAKYRYQRV